MSDTAAPDAPATSAPPSVRRWPRIAVIVVFVGHGLLFASLTAHIPDVKAHLGLTDGMGLARALKTPPQHHGRPAGAGSTR